MNAEKIRQANGLLNRMEKLQAAANVLDRNIRQEYRCKEHKISYFSSSYTGEDFTTSLDMPPESLLKTVLAELKIVKSDLRKLRVRF